jgi:DNA-binding transcriptional MerR regulator
MILTTEMAAEILGLKPWRVIKFAQGKEYGIRPSLADAKGSGSRRLYDLENVCQIGLALRLLETGLRPKAIGKVISQVRKKEKLSNRLRQKTGDSHWLAIYRTPKMGELLNEKREQIVELVSSKQEAFQVSNHRPDDDLILVPLASFFVQIRTGVSRFQGD